MRALSGVRENLRVIYRSSPEGFRRAMRVRRHAGLWRNAGILFVHVPKCAGTSISETLYGQFTNHVYASDIERWGEVSVKALPSFAVTRNPWDRLLSAYRFAIRGHGEGGDFLVRTWRPEQYQTSAFATFESFVEEWLVDQKVAKLDPIFKPQKLFVCNETGNALVDHVGKVEDLGPTKHWIESITRKVQQFPHHNRSGKPVCYRDFYSKRLINIVGDIYGADATQFDYEF